jgi:N-acyl-D-amino-acid deacylase
MTGDNSAPADDRLCDLLIRGGDVIDGSGAPAVRADVAVRDGRIVAVGEMDAPAKCVIDAAGMAVTPGFIDVHAHDDAAVLATPMDFKLMQGVTTDIVGNCGAGLAPVEGQAGPAMPGIEIVLGPVPDPRWRSFSEYMQAVDDAHPAINVACLVPHGVVRNRVLGMSPRAPDAAELVEMRDHAAEGMAAGAVGLSTGLIYPPGSFARTDEIVEVARAAAGHGGVYVSHIRDEGEGLLEAVQEAITIGREAGLPVQISHHKAGGPVVWGKTADSIALIEAQRSAGLDITFDVYPYTAASTILSAFARAGLERLDPDSVLVASTRARPEWEGKTLTQIGGLLDLPWADATRRVLAEEPAAVAIFYLMDEADVQRVLAHPLCMIGSDGIPSPTGKPHPRLYGTFPRVLGRYVRKERLFPLGEAVRKMTSLPARRFGLTGRGELREGFAADIVIFDPATIEDTATYEDPRQYPAGVEYVIVNGEVAAERGAQTEARAGRVLRRDRATV